MATKKHSLLVKLISVVLLVVILLGAVAAILLLQTPKQLGRDQNLVGNYTVEKLGFANVSYWDILKMMSSVAKTHNINKISPNHFTENDGKSADEVFANTLISILKKPQYSRLLYLDALRPRSNPIVLTEKQLAYAVNSALNEFYESPVTDFMSGTLGLVAVETLQNLSISVTEMTFYQQDDKTYLKIVTQIQLSDYVDEAKRQSLNLADVVYCTFENEIAIPAYSIQGSLVRGELTKKNFVGVTLNDLNSGISKKALNALLLLVAKNGSSALNADMVNTCVFTVVQLICGHIGNIGMQAQDGTPTIGVKAIDFEAHTISFVPAFK